MNIAVCMKQVLDPEIPPRDFAIDQASMQASKGNASLVTSIFCENALETALQLREKLEGKITAYSFGAESTKDVLRKALALRADEAVLIQNTMTNPDSLSVAKVLAAAISKGDKPDLVMVGREAADWGAAQTGGLLAEELKMPFVGFVDSIEKGDGDGELKLHRQTDSGFEIVTAKTPLVVSITNNDQNLPRIPKTRDVMKSSKKTISQLSLEDLGLSSEDLGNGHSWSQTVNLAIPVKDTQCEFIEGDSIEDKIDTLANKILAIVRAAG